MKRPILLFLLAFGASCGPHSARGPAEPETGQTFAQAIELMCQVDQKAGLDAEDDPIGVEGGRVDWIHANIDNGDAIELYTLIRVKSHSEQAAAMRRNATKSGITKCALADALDEQASVLD